MKYLLFSSLGLLVAACSPKMTFPVRDFTGKDCLISAAPGFTTELYNATMDVYGNHVSGLMLFKAMDDNSRRIVFTTETGLTFFDFEWDKSGKFSVKQIIKKLDRKVIIYTLRRDLELIVIPGTYSNNAVLTESGKCSISLNAKEKIWFSTGLECKAIETAEVRSEAKVKTKVFFFPKGKNVPDSVYIQHLNFNMKVTLRKIAR